MQGYLKVLSSEIYVGSKVLLILGHWSQLGRIFLFYSLPSPYIFRITISGQFCPVSKPVLEKLVQRYEQCSSNSLGAIYSVICSYHFQRGVAPSAYPKRDADSRTIRPMTTRPMTARLMDSLPHGQLTWTARPMVGCQFILMNLRSASNFRQ